MGIGVVPKSYKKNKSLRNGCDFKIAARRLDLQFYYKAIRHTRKSFFGP